jgi:hypothetical protein
MDRAQRLSELYARLDDGGRASLLDFAEFLAARRPAEKAVTQPLLRPARETVVQAIRRLNRSYPMLKRHRLMPRAEELLARHMVDGRPAGEVIDELEAFYAAEYRLVGGQ